MNKEQVLTAIKEGTFVHSPEDIKQAYILLELATEGLIRYSDKSGYSVLQGVKTGRWTTR